MLRELVIVNDPRLLIQPVRHLLKVDARRGDVLRGGGEAVAQVAAVRQVEAHDALVRLQKRRVHLQPQSWLDAMF